jgi:hypothetical protein
MNDNAPDPTLKGTFVLKGVYLGKYFYKSLLQHILRIFPVVGEPVADGQHLRAVPVVQLPLSGSLIF